MKIIILIVSLFLSLTVSASQAPKNEKSPQEIYIEQFATLAVEEMYRSGVPASITLAQGLLESRYGLSELAVKGNNHFGIKCHNNWKGGKMYYDDDRQGECFRKYSSPEQSYRDHSDFLRYRDRYKFLFDYKITDYKSWAHGLKKAGYATDPAYPTKLIKIIEDYDLHKYDSKPASFAKSHRKQRRTTKYPSKKKDEPVKQMPESVVPHVPDVPDELPKSPNEIEHVEALTVNQRHDFRFSVSREVYVRNGVPFVKSAEGETYASIAAANNLFAREILKFNELDAETDLLPGTEVYLKPKKKQAVKGLEMHVVEKGETMRSISQRYGVKLKSLYKLNGMADSDVPREGDIIKLRK
ncbi:MAG: glucosaminidase domain-containing protein [Bacteroidales bacterium]|nr:glucosaminidase domain-containing protein [Bacteroidales bacterium]